MADDEELLSVIQDEKNWRGIGISLFVIVTVCSLIVIAIFLLSPGAAGPRVKSPRFTLDEVINGEFIPRRFNGTWISDKEIIYLDTFGTLVIYNVENRAKTNLITNITFKHFNAFDYSLSADRRYLLVASEFERVHKYSFTAKYKVIKLTNQSDLVETFINDKRLQFASWGPSGNQLVYVQSNNILYLPNINHLKRPWQLTQNGKDGDIYNGIPDWLYEHEILHSNNAIWWPEDGSKLCYISFNDTIVTPYEYPIYGAYESMNSIYPHFAQIRYPKAGQPIPTVKLWIVELNKLIGLYTTKSVTPPKEYQDMDYYVTSVQWLAPSSLSVIWLNRLQNSSIVTICKQNTNWICEKNFQEDSIDDGWVEMNEMPIFTFDREYYFLRLPIPEGEEKGFRHIGKVSVKNGRVKYITSGMHDVTRILGYSNQKSTVYFIKTLKHKPGQRHLASVKETNASNIEECLTCNLNTRCLYNNAILSPNVTYYILECLGPGIPRIEIRSISGNRLLGILDENNHIEDLMKDRALPLIRTVNISLESDYNIHVRLYLPPGLRDNEITRYPLLVHADGSPGCQMVSEKFQINWGTYLASKKDYIYAWVDGRGSGFEGKRRIQQVNKQLGNVEIRDYVHVMKYLKNSLPFINEEQIAIWGWGYGGYTSIATLTEDDTVYQCAISVAPITSWTFHDAAFTEKYMEMPRSPGNYIGYEKADVNVKASNLKNKRFLLIHGTADDMVHIQHSMMLMKALAESGIPFQSQLYPDENHDLRNVQSHLYATMEEFLEGCFENKVVVT